jgi:GMP synthase (glutamine-hydrolysing)
LAKILAVNNYPTLERFKRLEVCLLGNGAAVTCVDWNSVSTRVFDSFDGVVLSGSPDMLSDERVRAKYGREIESILDTKSPILGVCFGHQMIASAFGSKVVRDGRKVLEMVKTEVLNEDPLFDGLPTSLMLLESRHEVVKALPKGFELVATSETSKIATMKHHSRPIYGVQFHPERFTKRYPDGNEVVGNFVRMVR